MRLRSLFVAPGAMLLAVMGLAGGARPVHALTYTVPKTIPSSCKAEVDVTAALQQWINSVPDGSTLIFKQGGCYEIEGSLFVSGRNNLTFDGQGAGFIAKTDGSTSTPPNASLAKYWPRGRSQWIVDGGSAITLQNMIVHGANPNAGTGPNAYVSALEEQAAVHLDGVAGATVTGVTASDTYGDFVSVAENASGVTITNDTFDRSGRQGVSVVWASDVLIQSNHVYDVARSAFDLEPALATWQIQRVQIVGNDIGPLNNRVLANGGAAAPVSDITFDGNQLSTVLSVQIVPPVGSRRQNINVTNNTSSVTTNHPPVISYSEVDGGQISGNYQAFAGKAMTGGAISLQQSCNITVGANLFPGAPSDVETDGYAC